MSLRINCILVQERKATFHLIRQLFFVFNTIFKLDSTMQIIYCIIHRCLCSHFIPFSVLLYQSLRNGTYKQCEPFPIHAIGKSLNNHKMNGKSKEYQSIDPVYVTGKINSRILELLLRRFCCLIFAPFLKNLNMLYSDKAFSQRLQKIFQPLKSVDTASCGSYKNFPSTDKRFWLTSIQKLI